jgi:NAD-dependent dihydropyrimidine dehydrogenase PreA subunit
MRFLVNQKYLRRAFIMAYVITDECVSCGSCADACPNDCITEGDDKYVINADECLDCGSCADECPNDAIKAE